MFIAVFQWDRQLVARYSYFVAAGLELVQDEAAQLVMQKCGIPALGIADLFACFPHFETLGIVKPES